MYYAIKLWAAFMLIVLFVIFFKDTGLIAFGKEDFRGAAESAAKAVATKNMDWAALRVGDAPYIMPEGAEEIVNRVVKENLDVNVDNMKVRMVLKSEPAMVGVVLESSYDRQILKLGKDPESEINIPARALEIIEAKSETYNY